MSVAARIARFDAWWSALSRREQWLLGILAALLLGVVLVFGVVKPLQAARAQAFADIRTWETYSARLRAAGTLAAAPPPRTGPPLTVVSDAAIAAGLSAHAEPIAEGVRATIADGAYDAVLAWLSDLGSNSRLRVVRVSLKRMPTAGHVAGTVDFAP